MNIDNEEVEDDLVVVAEDGTRYRYGANTARTKIYDSSMKQISKSCHVCQDQHIKFKCQNSETCSFSFCRSCLNKYHERLSLRDAIQCCPVCRFVCSCRACLRKMANPKLILEQNPEENQVFAKHILKCCGPSIRELISQFDEEVNRSGKSMKEIPIKEVKGDFVTCDLCFTSISDLHYACRECREGEGTEICIRCIAEARILGVESFEKVVQCTHCLSRLELTRLMSINELEMLHRISEEFGSGEDRPVLPVLTYPWFDEEDPVIEVDLAVVRESIRMEYVIKRPLCLDAWIEAQNQFAKRRIQNLEKRLKPMQKRIQWRDAGNGQFVRCIDPKEWSKEAITQLLSLCVWIGEPLIFRNIKGIMDWRPQTMTRVFADRKCNGPMKGKNKKRRIVPEDEKSDDESPEDLEIHPDYVCVFPCGSDNLCEYWKQSKFFSIYHKGGDEDMFKIKDWPSDMAFGEKLVRHYQDFIEMLPAAVYTNPVSGMLNLTTALPEARLRPDLGPKTYLATGRFEERNDGTDSVTKLHLDMADAINILLHSQSKTEDEKTKAGAIWTMIARKDVARLTEYLKTPDGISQKEHYLTQKDREYLVQQGVKIWSFEQFDNEAIYVPSGCPHLVRNMKSCMKIANDFFPPESAAIVMALTEYRRQFAKRMKSSDNDVYDKLQGKATMLFSCIEAYSILQGRRKNFEVVDTGFGKIKKQRHRRNRKRKSEDVSDSGDAALD